MSLNAPVGSHSLASGSNPGATTGFSSVCGWCKITSAENSLNFVHSAFSNQFLQMGIDGSGLLKVTAKSGGSSVADFAAVTCPSGWFHFAVTIQETVPSTTAEAKLYINGTLAETLSINLLTSTSWDDSRDMLLGTFGSSTMSVKFYDWAYWAAYVLTGTEVTNLNGGSIRPSGASTGPTTYWTFDSPTTGTATNGDAGMQDTGSSGAWDRTVDVAGCTWDTDFPSFAGSPSGPLIGGRLTGTGGPLIGGRLVA